MKVRSKGNPDAVYMGYTTVLFEREDGTVYLDQVPNQEAEELA